MQDNELYLGKFKRALQLRPAYDRRHPDPKQNYGIHGMDMRFLLIGPKGVTQFLFYSGIHLPHVADELANKAHGLRLWMGADVGYHSPKPMYPEHAPMPGTCDVLEGKTCYYDGSSLAASELAEKFVAAGEQVVWDELVSRYEYYFEREENGTRIPRV